MTLLRRLLLLILLFSAPALSAQVNRSGPVAGPSERDSTTELFLGVSPDEVTVGDRFQVLVRVDGPDGYVAEYPEITGGDTIQSLEPVRMAATAAGDTVAVYTLVAWIAGQPLSASLPVRLRSRAGVSELQVSLPLPRVVSVLPAGDTIVEPRPAKPLIIPGLLGNASSFWIYLLLAALVAGILGFWLLDRRRQAEVEAPSDPRAWALAQLDLLEDAPAGELDHREERYRRVSRILRLYIARAERTRGLDLTTTELISALETSAPSDVVASLSRMLQMADRVKFAGLTPGDLEGKLLIDDARAFVARYPAPERSALADTERAA